MNKRRARLKLVLGMLVVAAIAAAACSSAERPAESPVPNAGVAGSAERAMPPGTTTAVRPRIVILGDSLTAGLGLPPEQAFPAVLQGMIDAEGFEYEVVNAGVSGDTSAGGLRRLDWALDGDVRILIVALGGNDGLRGLSAEDLGQNLSTIIERAQARGISVVLAGMEAPPNLGPAYTRAFRDIYRDVAKRHDVAFLPFLLDGVAGVTTLNQRDGIHPNTEGALLIAKLLWPVVKPIAVKRRDDPRATP